MSDPTSTQIHATCVEIAGAAILIRGPSGSGKSDLALRLIDEGGRLVADDRTDLAVEGGRLFASCPATIAGKIEAWGQGVFDAPAVARAPVAIAVDLAGRAELDRLPPARVCDILGVAVPLLRLDPFEASATAKLRLVARAAARGRAATGA